MLLVSMAIHTRAKKSGFTIVELLVVIVTLGILAGIGTVGWGGLKTSSENKSRISELNQWKSTFDLYKSRFAVYPAPSVDGTYCIGDSFPADKCGVGSVFSENAPLNIDLARTGKLPTNTLGSVKIGSVEYLGPYAIFTPTTIALVGVLKGGSDACTSGTTYDSTSPSGVAYCKFTLTR